MPTAIALKNTAVLLGNKFPAVNDITVELPAGRIIGFIGPSGAGKTTLIRAIVGRQTLSGGSATVLGKPAGSAPLRHQVTYMTQEAASYGDLSVRENLRYFCVMAGIKRRVVKATVTKILAQVDLARHADQMVDDLSGGQKQRVSLGIALIGSPKLMVLDEPTVGLDPVLREQLWKLFGELVAGGTTLIISSHVMDEASRCDDLVLIRDGKLLAHGTPAQLCENTRTKSVEQAFLKLVGDKA